MAASGEVPPRVQAFPSSDATFVAFVHASWAELAEPRSPTALQQAIRRRYPTAIVTVQHELARHGDDPLVWYAFRTGAIEPPGPLGGGAGTERPAADGATSKASRSKEGAARPGRSRADDPTAWPAWAILDDDRRFVEVSPRLAEIAEVSAEVMLGHRVEEFSNPADPTIREDIARLWLEFLRRRSLASTLRFNFRDGTPRELEYRLVADVDGPGRHRLSVRELGR